MNMYDKRQSNQVLIYKRIQRKYLVTNKLIKKDFLLILKNMYVCRMFFFRIKHKL